MLVGRQFDIARYPHVAPHDRLALFTACSGAAAKHFDFASRTDDSSGRIVAALLLSLVAVSHSGTVVFFASYAALDTAVAHGLKQRLQTSAAVFVDNRSEDSQRLLDAHADAVSGGGRAVLLTAAGGRLAEGINFADDRGRPVCDAG